MCTLCDGSNEMNIREFYDNLRDHQLRKKECILFRWLHSKLRGWEMCTEFLSENLKERDKFVCPRCIRVDDIKMDLEAQITRMWMAFH
jgi:hypothetical protein